MLHPRGARDWKMMHLRGNRDGRPFSQVGGDVVRLVLMSENKMRVHLHLSRIFANTVCAISLAKAALARRVFPEQVYAVRHLGSPSL